MKAQKEINKPEQNNFTSVGKLTEKELLDGIKAAEKGPFYTVQESMNHFEEWLIKREDTGSENFACTFKHYQN